MQYTGIVFSTLRNFFRGLAGRVVLCVTTAVIGALAGWFARDASKLAWGRQAPPASSTSGACRDEVVSVDNARGPVSCSQVDMASELKDGYLVCRCKKK